MTEIERLLNQQLQALEAARAHEMAELRGLLAEQQRQFEVLQSSVSDTLQQFASISNDIQAQADRASRTATQALESVTTCNDSTATALTALNSSLNSLQQQVDGLTKLLKR